MILKWVDSKGKVKATNASWKNWLAKKQGRDVTDTSNQSHPVHVAAKSKAIDHITTMNECFGKQIVYTTQLAN